MTTAKKQSADAEPQAGDWTDPTVEVFEREAELHKAAAKEAEAEAKAES